MADQTCFSFVRHLIEAEEEGGAEISVRTRTRKEEGVGITLSFLLMSQ